MHKPNIQVNKSDRYKILMSMAVSHAVPLSAVFLLCYSVYKVEIKAARALPWVRPTLAFWAAIATSMITGYLVAKFLSRARKDLRRAEAADRGYLLLASNRDTQVGDGNTGKLNRNLVEQVDDRKLSYKQCYYISMAMYAVSMAATVTGSIAIFSVLVNGAAEASIMPYNAAVIVAPVMLSLAALLIVAQICMRECPVAVTLQKVGEVPMVIQTACDKIRDKMGEDISSKESKESKEVGVVGCNLANASCRAAFVMAHAESYYSAD